MEPRSAEARYAAMVDSIPRVLLLSWCGVLTALLCMASLLMTQGSQKGYASRTLPLTTRRIHSAGSCSLSRRNVLSKQCIKRGRDILRSAAE